MITLCGDYRTIDHIDFYRHVQHRKRIYAAHAVSQKNGAVRLLITHQDQYLEALINLQLYTRTAAPSEATLPLVWQYGAQQEGHQWVLAGFASAIFTRNVNCESRGVTHG